MAFRIEGGLMSHKVLVLLVMLAGLAGLIATDQAGTLERWRFRLIWKFGRRQSTVSPREATLVYQRLLSILQKKGLRRTSSQTPREFALSCLTAPWGPGVSEFTKLYNLVRFGHSPVAITRLKQILDEISTN